MIRIYTDRLPILSGLTAISTLFAALSAVAAPPQGSTTLLIQPRVGVPNHVLEKQLATHGAEVVGEIGAIGVKLVNVPDQAAHPLMKALANTPHINFVEEDAAIALEATPNDPSFVNQWHHTTIQSEQAWDNNHGDNITIAILDTGIDPDHPDLASKLRHGWNAVSQNSDWHDIHGHGTQVAGSAAAIANNSIGVAGVAWNADILPVRVTNNADTGTAYVSDIARGLTWAADQGADVANISYGVSSSDTISSAAGYLQSKGGVAVVSAGNEGTDYGIEDKHTMITVSATNNSDAMASWSNFGNNIDIAAPGTNILTTANGGGYGAVAGTSFSSPITAGVVALIKSTNPTLIVQQVEEILESTADDRGTTGWDIYYGHGRLNANAAVIAALNTQTLPDTEAPQVSIEAPVGGDVSGLVNIDISAFDNTTVSEVSVFIHDQFHGSVTSPPYHFSWDTTTFAGDWALIEAFAKDNAGNQSSASVVVNVINSTLSDDTVAPTVQILSPYENETFTGGRITVSAVGEDNVAVTEMTCFFNDTQIGIAESNTITCGINLRKTAPGTHTITVNAADSAGNQASHAINITLLDGSSDSDTTKGGGNSGNNKGKGKQ